MNIRWRLGLLALQLSLLSSVSWWVVGTPVPFAVWFVSGLLGLLLAMQLSEPFFTRPTDALVSCATVAALVLVADKASVPLAWWVVGSYALLGIAVAVVSLLASGPSESALVRALNFRSYRLTKLFSGRTVFSLAFGVAVFADSEVRGQDILVLYGAWAFVLLSSGIRWDQVLFGVRSSSLDAEVVGIVAPSRVVVAARTIPEPGSRLELQNVLSSTSIIGHVVRRTPSGRGIVGHVEVGEAAIAEGLIGKRLNVRLAAGASPIVGVVGEGTTQGSISFHPFAGVEIGDVLGVTLRLDDRKVLYQTTELRIVEDRGVSGTPHLRTVAQAAQIGYVEKSGRLTLHRSIPAPGDAIERPGIVGGASPGTPAGQLCVGTLFGTAFPVSLDLDVLCSGHSAVLGMTRMGKSTFAHRLAERLGKDRVVLVVDQTGEYRKRGLPIADPSDLSSPGVRLRDLEKSAHPHQEALKALRTLESLGRAEFVAGTPTSRVLLVEEAHQFVPEPSMLGFGVPGRDEAIEFGLLMMQVRKFGVSVILISQRTAVVAKSALSQCENVIAFKSVDQTGLDYLEALGGSGIRGLLPRLGQGEAVVMGPSVSSDTAVAVQMAAVGAPALISS